MTALLMTPAEAARQLAISEKQLRELTAGGKIRYVNIGNGEKRETRRYTPQDLASFIEARSIQECRYRRPDEAIYSYDFWHRGARFSGSTNCTSKREAEKYEEAVRKEVKAWIVDRAKPMTFAVASSLYWDEKGQFLANSSDLERDLAWLEAKIGKSTLISGIGDADIAAAVAKRRGDGVSNATVNRSVTQPLRAILRRAGKTWKQSLQDIDWKDHFLPEPQERVREANLDEEAAFMAAIRGDYGPALRFAILSGCRRAEIVGMEWRHVNFFNREIHHHRKG